MTSGGGEAGPVIDITNEATLPKRATITLRRSKLHCLIGHHIADEQVTDILRRLGCEVTEGKDAAGSCAELAFRYGD